MKSKQLANVLIKIIGLYVCLLAIPGVVSGFVFAFLETSDRFKSGGVFAYLVPNLIIAVVQFVVGMVLISKSRKLSEFWFKNEEE